MKEYRIRLSEWGYPMVLWFIVAVFTLLACRNVVVAAVPAQPEKALKTPFQPFVLNHGDTQVVAIQ